MSLFIAMIVSIIVLSILYVLKKKRVNFPLRVLIALILGLFTGMVFKESVQPIGYIGVIYTSLIKMIVIPLVMVSLIKSIGSLDDTDKLKSIGIKTIGLLLFTTAIATLVGILVGNIFNVGTGISFNIQEGFQARSIPDFSKVLNDMMPVNPIGAMADGKIIPVIIFSMFISIAMIVEKKKNYDKIQVFIKVIDSLNVILIRITKIVLKFTPYGVFGLMTTVGAENGIATLLPLISMILAVYAACLIQILIVYSVLIIIITKKNPFKFFKDIYPAQVVAFTTQSSYGTLPVTIDSLVKRANVSEEIASFVAPIGSTIGMNGCGGIYPAIVAIFVANVFNIDLTMMHYILLILTTVIGSIGIAGVPGAATISSTLVLSSLGLPLEGLAMVLGIDAIIDMIRTMTNVTGSSVVALLVDKITIQRKNYSEDLL